MVASLIWTYGLIWDIIQLLQGESDAPSGSVSGSLQVFQLSIIGFSRLVAFMLYSTLVIFTFYILQ